MESLKIKVDLKRKTVESIKLQQGYTYPLEVEVFDGKREFDCSGATPQIHFEKANGKFAIKTKDIVVEGNKIRFKLDSDMTNISGASKLQVILTKDEEMFGSWVIYASIFENAIQISDTDDMNIVDVLIDLTQKITIAEPLVDMLENQNSIANSLNEKLEIQIPQAELGANVLTDLSKKIDIAEPLVDILSNQNSIANDLNEKLTLQIPQIELGTNVLADLSQKIGVAEPLINTLSSQNSIANELNNELTIQIPQAELGVNILTDLSEKISIAEPLISTLTDQNSVASDLNEKLEIQIPQAESIVAEAKQLIEEGGVATKGDIKKLNEQYDNIVANNAEFKEQMNVDFGNVKTDYFGKEHLSVEERLNEDFDNVHQRINNSSLLEYEGCNISADNTYYGITKDTVIKGRTLQNLFTKSYDGEEVINNANNSLYIGTSSLLKPSTTYTICYIIKSSNIINCSSLQSLFRIDIFYSDNMIVSPYGFVGTVNNQYQTVIAKFSTSSRSDISTVKINLRNAFTDYPLTENTLTVKDIIILEGDHTNTPIEELPYGEGIYSAGDLVTEGEYKGKYKVQVKSSGKNLFDSKLEFGSIDFNTGTLQNDQNQIRSKDFIKVKGNTSYICKTPSLTYGLVYAEYDSNYNFIKCSTKGLNSLLTDPRTSYLKIRTFSGDSGNINLNTPIQIEESETSTEYEPYQEDIKTYYLDEPLNGLPNGVCDTIEENKIVRRVGKIVLNGGEPWVRGGFTNDEYFELYSTNILAEMRNTSTIICDRFPVFGYGMGVGEWCIVNGSSKGLSLRISKTKLTGNQDYVECKQWLSENPTTVWYELAEPYEEYTNTPPLKLKSWDTKTYITSTNKLLPSIKAKIPSNVQAVVSNLRNNNNTLTKEVFDLSLENKELKDTNDVQDVLIDTTMMATDEMFTMIEPLLSQVAETLQLSKEVSKLVDMYVAMVMRGLKTIDEVPSRYREQVKEILAQLEK